jgi:NAD(P)-dependent dehydrogenase (short-subunit alcohol dehydrogenase family)
MPSRQDGSPLTDVLQSSPERSQIIMDRSPLRRWGQPADLVGGVLYLCSPVASFVTGTILVIDGGYAIS